MTVDDHLVTSSHFTDAETEAQRIVKSTQSEQRPRLLALGSQSRGPGSWHWARGSVTAQNSTLCQSSGWFQNNTYSSRLSVDCRCRPHANACPKQCAIPDEDRAFLCSSWHSSTLCQDRWAILQDPQNPTVHFSLFSRSQNLLTAPNGV